MIKIKKITPMFNSIITTMDKYNGFAYTSSGLIDGSKKQDGLKEYQKVVAVGSAVRSIKVGDLVCVNPSRYAVLKHQKGTLKDGVVSDNPVMTYNFNVVEMNDNQYLLLQDSDIEFIIDEYEEIKEEPSKIVLPPEKKIEVFS